MHYFFSFLRWVLRHPYGALRSLYDLWLAQMEFEPEVRAECHIEESCLSPHRAVCLINRALTTKNELLKCLLGLVYRRHVELTQNMALIGLEGYLSFLKGLELLQVCVQVLDKLVQQMAEKYPLEALENYDALAWLKRAHIPVSTLVEGFLYHITPEENADRCFKFYTAIHNYGGRTELNNRWDKFIALWLLVAKSYLDFENLFCVVADRDTEDDVRTVARKWLEMKMTIYEIIEYRKLLLGCHLLTGELEQASLEKWEAACDERFSSIAQISEPEQRCEEYFDLVKLCPPGSNVREQVHQAFNTVDKELAAKL